MVQENRDKQIYNTKMCIYCVNKDKCDKNKFRVFVYENKLVMSCSGYGQKI